MAIVLVAFGGGLFGSVWMFGLQIARQADDLYQAVSQAYIAVHEQLQQYRFLQRFLDQASNVNLQQTAATAASGLLWVAASFVLILFLGLYLSLRPQLYIDGFLSFFTPPERTRVARLLDTLGGALRWWLLGQLIAMTVVGIITTIGLLILKVPMAVPLGVLAMLLTFVPYVGALVSAVPAILLALTQRPELVLYVVFLYLIAHIIEGYVLVPLIQHRLVYLPPAMILATQFLMEIFAGTAGVTVATPLMVVTMVLVKQLYFKQDWRLKTVRLKE
jgi:predicted PurR-regulated permease PerM